MGYDILLQLIMILEICIIVNILLLEIMLNAVAGKLSFIRCNADIIPLFVYIDTGLYGHIYIAVKRLYPAEYGIQFLLNFGLICKYHEMILGKPGNKSVGKFFLQDISYILQKLIALSKTIGLIVALEVNDIEIKEARLFFSWNDILQNLVSSDSEELHIRKTGKLIQASTIDIFANLCQNICLSLLTAVISISAYNALGFIILSLQKSYISMPYHLRNFITGR